MKVYLGTEGSYSNYRVTHVFATAAVAQRALDMGLCEAIDEYEVCEILPDSLSYVVYYAPVKWAGNEAPLRVMAVERMSSDHEDGEAHAWWPDIERVDYTNAPAFRCRVQAASLTAARLQAEQQIAVLEEQPIIQEWRQQQREKGRL